jgi:hypothetical protein
LALLKETQMAELQIEDTEIGKGKACKAGDFVSMHTSGNSWFFVATRSTLSTSFLSILRQLVLSLTNAFKASSIFPQYAQVLVGQDCPCQSR